MTLATGGLHEDGLADTADGFGGGRTPGRRLEIMRDSRIGSYGAMALLSAFAVRGVAIAAIAEPARVAAALVASGALGRGAILLVLRLAPPARADGLSARAGRRGVEARDPRMRDRARGGVPDAAVARGARLLGPRGCHPRLASPSFRDVSQAVTPGTFWVRALSLRNASHSVCCRTNVGAHRRSEMMECLAEPRVMERIPGFKVRRVVANAPAIGPFVLFDHYGPVEFVAGQGLDIGPHPHVGMATLTYLFEGSMRTRDSLGHDMVLVPGGAIWMIAGRGAAHSERTPPKARRSSSRLGGAQLWMAPARRARGGRAQCRASRPRGTARRGRRRCAPARHRRRVRRRALAGRRAFAHALRSRHARSGRPRGAERRGASGTRGLRDLGRGRGRGHDADARADVRARSGR